MKRRLPKDCVEGRFLFKRVATLSFNGLKFQVGIAGELPPAIGGLATVRDSSPRILAFSKFLKEKHTLEVAIHEALHACFDARLSEAEVMRVGKDIARLLRMMGFHRHAAPRRKPKRRAR